MHSSTFLLCSLCFAFVSSTPVNPICPDYFTVFNPSDSSQTLKQRVCQSSSLVGTAQPSVQVAFVLAHGYNRDALSTYNYFHDAAVAYNDSQTTSAVFVAPQFLDEEDLTFHTLDSDYLFWPDYYAECAYSLSKSDLQRPFDLSVCDVYDQILAALVNRNVFPNLRQIRFVGFSEGAQSVMRYIAASTYAFSLNSLSIASSSSTNIVYFIADAGTLLYLDTIRPTSDGGDVFAVPPSINVTTCPGYNGWPYGLDDPSFVERYNPQSSSALSMRYRYGRTKIVYFIGELDTTTTASNLDVGCPAELQGVNRKTRITSFFAYVNQFYGSPSCVQESQKFHEIPGAGHDEFAIYNSDVSTPYFFGEDSSKVQFGPLCGNYTYASDSHSITWSLVSILSTIVLLTTLSRY